MDMLEVSTDYPRMSDGAIVREILSRYESLAVAR